MKQRTKRVLAWVLALVMMIGIGIGNPAGTMTAEAAGATPVATHGKLSVNGTQLVDSKGQPFQLRGISTHGLQWDVGYRYNNKAAFQTVRDDWGANCIRLAMYVGEGGYLSQPSKMKSEVNKGVSYATDLGMYVIIDWHILNDGTNNPKNHQTQAIDFFTEMAKKYKDYNNVIYEICNEPNGDVKWTDIKSYAEAVIPAIRKYDKDAIIIVGTPTWSQLGSAGDKYEPAENPIKGYSNIMYEFHFYASEPAHNQWQTEKIGKSIDKGLPVFVSEFGLSEASGNGNVDLTKAAEWMKRCDDRNVSYCAWSLCNKNESSALISSSCSKTSGWSASELSKAGQFIRNHYRSKMEDPTINNPEIQNMASNITVSYETHVQSYGWQPAVTNGQMSGTSRQSKRLEGIKIRVTGDDNLGIRYRTHIQSIGWQDWKYDGDLSGTTRQSKRLEAICIELTGANKDKYDVYYRVHAQSYGWLDWSKNGAMAGTEGLSKRLEAINIVIVPKNADPGVATSRSFVSAYPGSINYRTHVQTYGWESTWRTDGQRSGTTGQSKRLEAIQIRLGSNIEGGIEYCTHVQSYGWENTWRRDGQMSGTSGQAKRLEAIKIRLTGAAEQKYDVYYRVHVQSYGWLDWAHNGEMSGTSGLAKRLEGIEIRLVPKGAPAPGSTERTFIKR